MRDTDGLKVVANFFLDGAKIIFGSLVVGVFVPSAGKPIPWLTFLVGIAIAMVFLTVAVKLHNIIEFQK